MTRLSAPWIMLMLVWMLLLPLGATSFAVTPILGRRSTFFRRTAEPRTTEQEEKGKVSTDNQSSSVAFDESSIVMDLTLDEHRPMGCTIEESLAGGGHVFVASVKPAGHAEAYGLQVGDVIVGTTGLFGDLEDVTGLGIDKVMSMVTSRTDDEPLTLRVARGSTVLEEHEAALTELCANPDSSEEEAEQCVLEYLQGGYFDDTTESSSADDDELDVLCDPINDENCTLDALHNMWAEELAPSIGSNNGQNSDPNSSADDIAKEAVKPWSSRTSPSGTFARDPVTGEMRNIDS